MIQNQRSLTFSLLLAMSIALLLYIAYTDTKKSLTLLRLDAINSHVKTLQLRINEHLYTNAKLAHFIGFKEQVQLLQEKEYAIKSLHIQTQPIQRAVHPLYSEKLGNALYEEAHTFTLTLTLKNRFEQVAILVAKVDKQTIYKPLQNLFIKLIFLSLGVLFCFWLFLELAAQQTFLVRLQNASYALAYFLVASLLLYTLFGLYKENITQKSLAQLSILSKRLHLALEVDETLSGFSHINTLLQSYLGENSDMSSIALKQEDTLIAHTPPSKEASFSLQVPSLHNTSLIATLPKELLYIKAFRSIKNFLVLFIASLLISSLFLELANNNKTKNPATQAISIAKPLFFLIIFVEGLLISFLPSYFQGLLSLQGLSQNLVSILFSAYFLMYALILIPASKYIVCFGIQRFLLLAVTLLLTGIALLFFFEEYWILLLARALMGLAQGMLFSGVQVYLLEHASSFSKNKLNGIIVFGYNGGILAGTAIGALLVDFINPQGIFAIYLILSLALFIYIHTMLTNTPITHVKEVLSFKNILSTLKPLLKDLGFIKSILLIGLPSKITLGGVVVFALPLLLIKDNYQKEDIGQLIIFYSLGVLIINHFLGFLEKLFKEQKSILFLGSFLSGFALLCLGAYHYLENTYLKTLFIITGIFILGLSHGFIHAPLISYVSSIRSVTTLGLSKTVTSYRFLERIGHAIGPMLLSFILALYNYQNSVLLFVGVGVLFFTLLFLLLKDSYDTPA